MISDERLAYISKNPLCVNTDETLSIVEELQQHRAEKHKRRWRKISELHDFPEYEYFQLQTADGEINKNPFWIDDRSILQTFEEEDSGIGDVSIEMACQWYTGFRPLLKD